MGIIGKSQIAGGTAKRLEFEYTGTYNERLDDGVVELLSTGTLKVTKDTYIDAFLVGGGASGGSGTYVSNYSNQIAPGGNGGSSGYTKTIVNALLSKGVEYQVTIGAGGVSVQSAAVNNQQVKGNSGGATTAFGYTVQGGDATSPTGYSAGPGGSGGGCGAGGNSSTVQAAGAGGSDGGNGGGGYGNGGKGQGTTTREFGETTGKLYAGGGGGGKGTYSYWSATGAAGGEGGGGNGGTGDYNLATDGTANTGSGGGGGISNIAADKTKSGSGGSGIVCIRLHKE